MKNAFLSLASKLYQGGTRLRNFAYDKGFLRSVDVRTAVISVGNITAGGNGKTPLVMYLAEALTAKGFRPAVLSRGYGGSVRGPYEVRAIDDAVKVGDEPLLMKRSLSCPVVVSRNRVRGAKYIESNKLGDVILLDDGFQHRRLHRDLDIVCIHSGTQEAVDSFLAGELLPRGFFREERDRALRRAGIVVLTERTTQTSKTEPNRDLLSVLPETVPIFRSVLLPKGIVSLQTGVELRPTEAAVFCAIANPEGFLQTVRNFSFPIVGEHFYADHYTFTERDIVRMRKLHPGKPLLCTEKDAVKIPEQARDGIYVVKTECTVSPPDAFIVQVIRSIMRARKVHEGNFEQNVSEKKDVELKTNANSGE